MLNIVIPMAGRGQRFVAAGYGPPKPLIPVRGVPMVQVVIDNVRPRQPHRFLFLCLAEHLEHHGLADQLHQWAPDCVILSVTGVTEGAACTVLLARSWIDTAEPLMIANCDQWVDADINAYLAELDQPGSAGLIMTMHADHPKWSYLRFDTAGRIVGVVEKQVVSAEATVGIYNFRHGADFVQAADEMMSLDLRVQGEFYVAPTYDRLIAHGQALRFYNVGREGNGMYGLGTPADLEAFERVSLPAPGTRRGSDGSLRRYLWRE